MFRSIGEHAQVSRVCTKSGQFSQPCWAVVWSADHLLSGRCKKAFEFASKRLKTSENIGKVVHGGHSTSKVSTICAMQHGKPRGGVKARAGNPRHDRSADRAPTGAEPRAICKSRRVVVRKGVSDA